jgi:hypothetical protein
MELIPPSSGAIDVVGDVHGALDHLNSLLSTLGYRRGPAGWSHSEGCRLVFVGDYIDRGPEPVKSVALVRELCEDGVAFALLGNHDVNAIQFSLRRDRRGILDPIQAHSDARAVLESGATPAKVWLRSHEGNDRSPKNIHQHEATLRNTTADEYAEIVQWACRLPAWLELPGIRVVHAAWIPPAMRKLDDWASENGLQSLGIRAASIDHAIAEQRDRSKVPGIAPSPQLWHDLLDLGGIRAERSRPDSCEAVALERILKGVEAELPDGVSYRDVGNVARHAVRGRWFEAAAGRAFAEYALVRQNVREAIARDTQGATINESYEGILPMMPADAYPPDERPVFFGHYGLHRADTTDRWPPNVACVDMSAFDAAGGELAAYRWSGEQTVDHARLISASAKQVAR